MDDLGRSVLYLVTDDSGLQRGLAGGRALTVRATTEMQSAARIQLRADLLRLQSDFNAAQRLARDTSTKINREATFTARLDLAKFQSDLRTAEREQAASLRRMNQQSGGGIGGALATGLGVGTGAGLVQAGLGALGNAVGAGKAAFIDYNSAVEDTRAQLLAFTGSAQQADTILADLRKEADKTQFTFAQMSDSIATLVPISKQSGTSLNDLIKLTEILASLNPKEEQGGGFRGAALALGNAQSGDLQSLRDRFNINTQAIQRYRAEGLTSIEAIRRGLRDLGIDESLVANQSRTFAGQLSTLQDALSSLAGRAGAPIFEGLKAGLGGASGLLNSQEVQRDAAAINAAIARMVADITKELARPETQQGLRALAGGLEAATRASLEADRAFLTLGGGGILKAVEALGFLDRQVGRLNGGGGLVGLLGGVPHLVSPVLTSFNDLAESWGRFVAILQTNPAIPAAIKGVTDRIGITKPGAAPAPPPVTQDVSETYAQDFASGGNQLILRQQQQASTERQRQAFLAGQAELQGYLRGFTSQSNTIFGQIEPALRAGFDHLYGELDKGAQEAKGASTISIIAARIVDDLRKYGAVQTETATIARKALGDQADAALALAHAYERIQEAQGKVTRATLASGAAAGNLATVRANADATIKTAEGRVTAAEATARAHASAAQHEAQGLQDRLDGIGREADGVARGYDTRLRELQQGLAALGREADNVARGYDARLRDLQGGLAALGHDAESVARGYSEQLRGLQGTLTGLSRAADAAQRAFAEQLRAAQGEQQAAQEAATRNAAAYAAVLSGTTDEYLRQNRALSDQERQIVANGNAAVRAALQAKAGADSEVQALEVRQRRDLLALGEKIRAARQPGGAGEAAARALEDQRNLVKARSDYALDLARQRAAVRGDEADAAKKPVEEAAKAQSTADKERTDAASGHVADIQEQARQRADADRDAQQALQDQIAGVQEQAREAATMYADRQRAAQDQIAGVQEEARLAAQDYADRQRALQDQIAGVQEEARQAATMYAERQRGVQEEIRLVNERARAQATADQAAIDGATIALGIVKQLEQARIDAAKLGADNAQRGANAAKAELDAQTDILTRLGQQNQILDARIATLKANGVDVAKFFNGAPPSIEGQPSAVGGGRDAREDGSGASGASVDQPPPPGPAIGPKPQPSSYSKSALFAPLPTVSVPVPARLDYAAPQPPALNTAALAGAGAGASFARANLGGPVTISAPITFPNAQFTSDIDVERAVARGQEQGLSAFLAALNDDSAGGGALSGWRG